MPTQTGHQERGVTPRAVAFGLFICVAVGVLANTVRFVQHGSYMAFSHMPMSNLIPFLLSILGGAALAKGFGSRFAFSRAEWIAVFCMGFIGASGPTYGISGYLVGLMVAPYYFATPENRWAEYLHPHLPTWLIPTDESRAMTWFFEGLPEGTPIPWEVWLTPLFWWMLLIGAVGLACACVSAIIHRQWADHEKLVYPAITPILEMAGNAGTGGRWLPAFMKGRVFWAGFALTASVFGWNMIAWFYPHVPVFPTAGGTWIWLPNEYPPLWIFLSTVVICFSYFASVEVLFSIWFFDILYILQGGALNRLGFGATSPHYATGSFKWQTTGAFVGLALWWLWISRRHFGEVFRKALHPDRSPIDDSGEMLSCRGAFIGLAVSCLFIAAWLTQIGVEARLTALLIPTMLLIYLGVTKIVVDSGLIYTNPPTSAWDLSVAALGGSKALTASTNAALSLAQLPVAHYRGFITMPMAHIHRLADFVPKGSRRRLFRGVCAAFLVGTAVSILYNIWLGYTIGGYNFRPNYLIIRQGSQLYQRALNGMLSPASLETSDYGFFLIGAAAMAALNLIRYRFSWWPLHPIGLALYGMSLSRLTSTTLFVAWLAKYLMLKVAGAPFYRRSKPFFVGMLVGYILAVAAGIVVDSLWFPTQGHRVHKWY